jgi:hypothetical protein
VTAATVAGASGHIDTAPPGTPPTTVAASTTAAVVDDDRCTTAAEAVDVLVGLVGQPGAEPLQAAIAPALDELDGITERAPADLRQPLTTLQLVLSNQGSAGGEARTTAAATGDDEVVELVDELIVEVDHVVFAPMVLLGLAPDLIDRCPVLVRTVEDQTPLGDPLARARELRNRLDELGAIAIVEAFVPAELLDMTDRDMTVAQSGRQEDYERCAAALRAEAYGDNAGCDALHDACDTADLLACNDLYWVTPPGSEYESFGATCGRRVSFGSNGYGGFCDQLS